MAVMKYASGCAILLLTAFTAAASSSVQKGSIGPPTFARLLGGHDDHLVGDDAVVKKNDSAALYPSVIPPPPPPPPKKSLGVEYLTSFSLLENRTQATANTGSDNQSKFDNDGWTKDHPPSLFSLGKDKDHENEKYSSTKQPVPEYLPAKVPPPPPRQVIQNDDFMGGNWFSDTAVGSRLLVGDDLSKKNDHDVETSAKEVPPRPPPVLLRKEEQQQETVMGVDDFAASREVKVPPPRQHPLGFVPHNVPKDPDRLTSMADKSLTIPPPPPKAARSNVLKQQFPHQHQQGQLIRPRDETNLNYPTYGAVLVNPRLVPHSYVQQQNYVPMHMAPDPRQQPHPHRLVDPRAQYQRQPPQRPPPRHQPQEGRQQNNWQQQQHRAPPPRRIHQHQQRPNRESEQPKPSTSRLLSTLWKKVEKGLDGLTDVENTVTEQAQQFIVRRRLLNPVNTVTRNKQQNRPAQPVAPQQRFRTRVDNAAIPKVAPMDANAARQIDWAVVRTGRRAISSGGGSITVEPTNTMMPEPSRQDLRSNEKILGTERKVTPVDLNYSSSQTATAHNAKAPLSTQQQPPKENSGDRRPLEFRAALQISEKQPIESEHRRFPDEEDDDSLSILDRIGRFLPRFSALRFRRGLSEELVHSVLEAWKADDEESLAQKRKGWRSMFGRRSSDVTNIKEASELELPALESISSRVGSGTRQNTVLRPTELRACRSIGSQKAAFDLISVSFIVVLVQQLQSLGVGDIHTTLNGKAEALFRLWSYTLESWAPYALACVFLSWQQGKNLARRKEVRIVSEATESARVDANYGAMMLHLTKGSPIDRKAIELVLLGVRSQISSAIGIARLKTYALVSVLLIGMYWGPDFYPILQQLGAVLASLTRLVRWPVDINLTVSSVRSALAALWLLLETLAMDFVTAMFDHPVLFSFKTAVGISLIGVSFVPGLIRQNQDSDITDEEDDDQDDRLFMTMTEQLVGFGASGANRLNLMAGNLLESLLDRWIQFLSSTRIENSAKRISIGFLAEKYLLCLLSFTVLLAPFSFYSLGNIDGRAGNTLAHKFGSIFDLSCVFVFAQILVWDAISKVSVSARLSHKSNSFLEACSGSINERKRMALVPTPNLDFMASISPSAGLSVSNLWVSFATKRAWALRGVSFACRKGEVVVVLSCDASSSAHLVRAIAEELVGAAPASRSFIAAQGTVAIGGLDVQTWEKNLLRKRVGVFLNDVRSTGDFAQVLSGLSLEEILCPRTGFHDFGDEPGETERSAMILALKLTGLYTSLLPRLPSKMATTVTANEEDLRASSLRPRCEFLSSAEWRKLLLARVLANAIFTNENSALVSGSAVNCLAGSILVFEDFSSYLSEVDEVRLIENLRQTGAACVVTSERWTTGRLANKAIIMRDGGIVEMGSHEELVSKGVQSSIYAAQTQNALGS